MSELNGQVSETRALNSQERELLLEFARAVAPGLVPFSMQPITNLMGGAGGMQLNVMTLSNLAFQAAGFMAMEYLQRCSGEKPTDGLNRVIPMRE